MSPLFKTHNIFFLANLILIGSFIISPPVQAEEISTSTPDIVEEDPAPNLPTELPTEEKLTTEEEFIIENETTTSTPDVNEKKESETTTSTPETTEQQNKVSTSTPDIIEENQTTTSTSTDALETPSSSSSSSTDALGTSSSSTPLTSTTLFLSTTTIHLQIETHDATIYNDNIIVKECFVNELSTSTALTPYCALQQLKNLDIEFVDYGGDARFLSKINTYDGSDWNWWAFFHNLNFASKAINEYVLQENDSILFTYGIWPLQMKISSTSPKLNTTSTIQIKEFGFNDSWQATWLESTSSTLRINGDEIILSNGIYNLNPTTTTAYEIQAKKNSFINSKIQTITPTIDDYANISQNTSTTPSTTTESNITDNDNNSGTSNDQNNESKLISQNTLDNTINKILNYLQSQQDETGKIIDGNITDWAIMSFGANNQYADDIKQNNGKSLLEYEKKYNLNSESDLNSCASYPRHILALMSAGVSTDDEAIIGLKNEIKSCHIENTYGQNGINDDVFALLALLALDEDLEQAIIQDLIIEIKSWQLDSGAFSWPDWFDPTKKTAGDDITGVALNALKYAEEKGVFIEQNIYSQAIDYLKTTQQSDGGWGYGSSDIMTTSWVLMGINSLNQNQEDWLTQEDKNPWSPLVEKLNEDGYYESAWVPGTVDWFAIKHAVPALAGTSWPIILDPVVKNFSEGATYTYGSSNASIDLKNGDENENLSKINTPTSTPTSTLDINLDTETSSSTPTSTIQTLDPNTQTSSSTSIIVTEKIIKKSKINLPATTKKTNAQHRPQTINTLTQTNTEAQQELINDENNNSNQQTEVPTISNHKQSGGVLSAPTTTTIPYTKTAKGVFAGATSMAGALGLYLAWRFLQTLV